jgi:O-antigen/teichoic acid export membrane protein
MSDPLAGEPDLLDTPQAGPVAIRGGVLRILSYAAGSLLSVAAAALLLRHLGVEDSGSYYAVLALAGVFLTATDLGLIALGVREMTVLEGAERGQAMRSLMGMRLVLGLVGGVLVVAFAAVVGYSQTLIVATAIGAIAVLLQGIQNQLATALQSRLRYGPIAGLELGRQALAALLVAAGVLIGLGLLSFVAVNIVAGVVVVAATALLVRGDVPLRPSFDLAASRQRLRDTGTYSAATAAHVLYLRAAVIIVSIVGSASALGNFAAAYRVIEVLGVLPGLAIGAGFPILARAARDDAARFRYVLSKMFDASLVLGTLLALVLALGAPVVISVLAGPEFEDAASVLRIQAAVIATFFVGAVWGFALLALGLYGASLRISVTAFAVGIPVMLLLTELHGAQGAAIATVAVELLVVALGAIAVARHDRALLPSMRLVPRVALAAALAIAPAVVFELSPFTAALVGSLVYVLAVILLRAVPAELYDELRRNRGTPA